MLQSMGLQRVGHEPLNNSMHCVRLPIHSEHDYVTLLRSLLIEVRACIVTQSHPILCDPIDCSMPGSSVHGILKARILEWIAISFSRGSS